MRVVIAKLGGKHDHRSEPSMTPSEGCSCWVAATGVFDGVVVLPTGVACFNIGTGVGACFSTPYIILNETGW